MSQVHSDEELAKRVSNTMFEDRLTSDITGDWIVDSEREAEWSETYRGVYRNPLALRLMIGNYVGRIARGEDPRSADPQKEWQAALDQAQRVPQWASRVALNVLSLWDPRSGRVAELYEPEANERRAIWDEQDAQATGR